MRGMVIAAVATFMTAAPALAHQDGTMQQRETADLKSLPPEQIVQAVTYCEGRYRVTTTAGVTRAVREFDLRFKTDGSDRGPAPGAPALLPAGMSGMRGDRAFLIFSDPAEISGFIEKTCAGN